MNDVSIDVESLARLPAKTLLEAISKQQDSARRSARAIATVKAFAPMFLELEALDIEARVTLDDGKLNICFSGDTGRFAKVWQILRRAGYQPNSRPKADEKQSSFATTWEFSDEFTPIWFLFTSSVCKRVQVGTKLVETPIYETQCGGIDIAAIEHESTDLGELI
jgi:hypothetical protein